MNGIDYFFLNHPFFARLAEKRIYAAFAVGVGENIAVHFAAIVACALFSQGAPCEWLYYLSFVIMFGASITCALLAGFRQHWIFPAYSAVLRFLPLLLLGEKNTQTGAIDEILRNISTAVTDYVFFPLYDISSDKKAICVFFFGMETAIFLWGIFLRKSAKQSRFYCETRIEMLRHDSGNR